MRIRKESNTFNPVANKLQRWIESKEENKQGIQRRKKLAKLQELANTYQYLMEMIVTLKLKDTGWLTGLKTKTHLLVYKKHISLAKRHTDWKGKDGNDIPSK
jgi:hypothetical protein